jgi:signal peptidase I
VSVQGHQVAINGAPLPLSDQRQVGERFLATERGESGSWSIAWPVNAREGDAAAAQHELTVPPGQLFLLGDNRHDAADSRWVGPVPVDQVLGCVAQPLDPA